jgi:TatD DNase family protein
MNFDEQNNLPLGHTNFSWNAPTDTVPALGHTKYSWGSPSNSNLSESETKSSTTTKTTTTTNSQHHTFVDVDANFLHKDLENEVNWHIQQASLLTPIPVVKFVTPCCCFEDLQKIHQLGMTYKNKIYVTAGVHPYWSTSKVGDRPREGGYDLTPLAESQIRDAARDPLFRCIGECGLDCCRLPDDPKGNGFPSLEQQLPWFEAQVRIAVDLQKPLFLHERKAHVAFLNVLDTYMGETISTTTKTTKTTKTTTKLDIKKRLLPPCLVHAFTGTRDELLAYRKRDYYIGITGSEVAKDMNHELRRSIVELVPLDRLMIETDSPYMGFKGCRCGEKKFTTINEKSYTNKRKDKYPNVPSSLPMIAKIVAKMYNVTVEEIANKTTQNAAVFFNMFDQKMAVNEEKVVSDEKVANAMEKLNEQAVAFQDKDQLMEACSIFQKILKHRESVLGSEHPKTLTSSWNVGIVYQDLGQLDLAETLLMKTLNGYTKVRNCD